MFCKNCGKQIPDEAVICAHCGAATDLPSEFNRQPVIVKKKTNGFAIAGLVLALVGIPVGSYTFYVVPLLGFIFSIIGLVKSKSYGGPGKGISIAGIVISCLSFVVVTVIFVFSFLPYLLLLI